MGIKIIIKVQATSIKKIKAQRIQLI